MFSSKLCTPSKELASLGGKNMLAALPQICLKSEAEPT
jgi:hypothetical protein